MATDYINRDLTLTRPEFWAIATAKGLGVGKISEITRIDWNNFYRKKNPPVGNGATIHWLGTVAQLEGWIDSEGNFI